MESIQRFIISDPTTLSLYPHNHPVFGFDYTFSETPSQDDMGFTAAI